MTVPVQPTTSVSTTPSNAHSSDTSPTPSTSKLPIIPSPPVHGDPIKKRRRDDVQYRRYRGEEDIADIMRLVDTELSEPYNIFTYRYFLSEWPHLCFMAYDGEIPVGTILCKQEKHRDKLERGYLAMLSTKLEYRGLGVATHLARLAISEMLLRSATEIVLETEVDNLPALAFYAKLGFIKEKRLYRFYLNSKDAYRLVLPVGEEVREGFNVDWHEVEGLVRGLEGVKVGDGG